jgi:excisionase family DNA binding protein
MYTPRLLPAVAPYNLTKNIMSNENTLRASTPSRPLLTPSEAASHLRVSRTTVYRMVRRREIPHCRIGAQLRFLPRDVDQVAVQRRVQSFHEYGHA